jgi:large subunit ribosomal protein L17
MLANLVCSLIKNDTIKTTLAKAKAARVVAEKMVTLGKKGTLHHRRLAVARLRAPQRKFFPKAKGVSGSEQRKNWTDEHDVVRMLFDKVVPKLQNRQGGYTRIVKLAGARKGDAAQLAYLTWVFDDTVASTSEKSEETESNVVESQVEEEVKEIKNAGDVVGENNESDNNADDGEQAEQQK